MQDAVLYLGVCAGMHECDHKASRLQVRRKLELHARNMHA
jgi:hypothetical protein